MVTAVNKTGPRLLQTSWLSKESALSWRSSLTRFYFLLEVQSLGLPLSGKKLKGGGEEMNPC